MSINTEQEQTTVEPSTETETIPSTTTEVEQAETPTPTPVVEEQKSSISSWFNNFTIPTIPPNLTNQLTNISSSLLQVTTKVSAAANTLVQKTLPQRPSTPTEDEEQTETTKTEETNATKDLASIFNDLSSTVIKSAQQLKHAVEEKSILSNFSKEHEKFVTEKRVQQRREEAAVPPWVGYVEEEEMKNQILALSKEKRNFLRSPPPGANYHFDMTSLYPVALATLEVDENLKQMRFDLVPKQINEETFWRNYFYRVSLIKQSAQLTALAQENANVQLTDGKTNATTDRNRTSSETQEKLHDVNQEFVSEDYDTSAVNMEEIRREIEQLTVTKTNSKKDKAGSPDETEWDKALTDDLENVSAEELEAQINQMLAGDTK